MRIGKLPRKSRSSRPAGKQKEKPKHVWEHSVAGQVLADVVATRLAPEILQKANLVLETYAAELLDYNDLQSQEAANGTATIEDTGEMKINQTPSAPRRPLWHSQYMINEFETILTETSQHFFAKSGGWKTEVNAAKFERLLDEKYGIFRPFITQHPGLEQFLRKVQRNYVTGGFSPFRQKNAPIPLSTAVVILFMLQRGGLRWPVLILASLYLLVGLQPWALVAMIALLQYFVRRRRHARIGTTPAVVPQVTSYYHDAQSNLEKHDFLRKAVGEPWCDNTEIDTSDFDTILLGTGPSCLYTASLLARVGRKILMLSADADASGCLTLQELHEDSHNKYKDIAFDVDASNVAKISKQQALLAPALATDTDCQGGIRFAQVGSPEDGYAYEIWSVPGMGADRVDQEIPFVLRAEGGHYGLMEDAATLLGDGWPGADGDIGHSTTGAYLKACDALASTASLYYLSKILPDTVNNLRSTPAYQECAIRYTDMFLNKSFPLNAHTRSLLAAMGMRGENIKPSATSLAAHVTNVTSAMSGEGMHYPVGGPRALCHAFANVVLQSGGRIFTSVPLKELVFAEQPKPDKPPTSDKETDGPICPRCVGVKLSDERAVTFGADRFAKNAKLYPVVVSNMGIVPTFIDYLDEELRSTYKVPRGFPALSERRPHFKALFLLQGAAADLEVSGADFYRLPNASIAFDEFDSETGTVNYGEIGGRSHSTNPLPNDPNGADQAAGSPLTGVAVRPQHSRRCKFEAGSSWIHISFPSAKDPSFEERHGAVTTCVVTLEADDDFVQYWDTKPILCRPKAAATAGEARARLLDRVTKDLHDTYPQLEGKVKHVELRGPFQKGLSHNPERYAAKGVHAKTCYSGLYLGGSDLTVGDSFSGGTVAGWLTANAVVGYSYLDHLFLRKNITSDLELFLKLPSDESDIAVPFKPAKTEQDNFSDHGTETD